MLGPYGPTPRFCRGLRAADLIVTTRHFAGWFNSPERPTKPTHKMSDTTKKESAPKTQTQTQKKVTLKDLKARKEVKGGYKQV